MPINLLAVSVTGCAHTYYLSRVNFMHGGGHYRTKNSVSIKRAPKLTKMQAFPQTMFSTTPITYHKLWQRDKANWRDFFYISFTQLFSPYTVKRYRVSNCTCHCPLLTCLSTWVQGAKSTLLFFISLVHSLVTKALIRNTECQHRANARSRISRVYYKFYQWSFLSIRGKRYTWNANYANIYIYIISEISIDMNESALASLAQSYRKSQMSWQESALASLAQ